MWDFIFGLAAGLTLATAYIKSTDRKVDRQRSQYENDLRIARNQVSQLSVSDAYKNGRIQEAQIQKQEKDKLQRRIDDLMTTNEELMGQLNNASAFANAWNTGRKAIVHIGQR